MDTEATIAAVSSGYTNAGVSVIRVSGEDAFSIADRVFICAGGEKLSSSPGYRAHFGHVVKDGEPIDEAVCLIMRAPHSYTGENTAEISCHGGILITKKVLDALFEAGARAALPGEFTKRAFLNGKKDLAEAEAVLDMIEAKSSMAARAASMQLTGKLSREIKDIREQILDDCAFIEAALDDPEHYSTESFEEDFPRRIDVYRQRLMKLLESFEMGRRLKSGIKTVILGKPNAGKSSLLNIFAGHEKAIVTDIAGTTRDVLSEYINIGGVAFEIIDTAGIRQTEDRIESIGVERSLQQAEDADLILYVVDSSSPIEEDDRRILSMIGGKKCIVIYNKTDLEEKVPVSKVEELLPGAEIVLFSATMGRGFDELSEKMLGCFMSGSVSANEEIIITNARHRQEIENALESLASAERAAGDGFGEDMWVIDLTDAYASLGRILGEELDSDVVNRVFEKFCMGK